MARHFTREAFHALVWSKPMTALAKEFAISDVALHKICRKHTIPTPPAGWWAKHRAGKPVRVAPLPPAVSSSSRGITIAAGHLGAETSMVAAAREAARLRAADASPGQGADPIVARTMARLAKAKPSDIGMVSVAGPDLIECEVAVTSIDRLGGILEGLAAAAVMQGFRITSADRTAEFRSGEKTIRFSVKETIKREKHVLTPAEVVKEEAWRAKQERAARRNSWDALFIDRPRFPDWTIRDVERFQAPRRVGRPRKRKAFSDVVDLTVQKTNNASPRIEDVEQPRLAIAVRASTLGASTVCTAGVRRLRLAPPAPDEDRSRSGPGPWRMGLEREATRLEAVAQMIADRRWPSLAGRVSPALPSAIGARHGIVRQPAHANGLISQRQVHGDEIDLAATDLFSGGQ